MFAGNMGSSDLFRSLYYPARKDTLQLALSKYPDFIPNMWISWYFNVNCVLLWCFFLFCLYRSIRSGGSTRSTAFHRHGLGEHCPWPWTFEPRSSHGRWVGERIGDESMKGFGRFGENLWWVVGMVISCHIVDGWCGLWGFVLLSFYTRQQRTVRICQEGPFWKGNSSSNTQCFRGAIC